MRGGGGEEGGGGGGGGGEGRRGERKIATDLVNDTVSMGGCI